MLSITPTELRETLELFSAPCYAADLLSHWCYLYDATPDEPLRKLDVTRLEVLLKDYLFELAHPDNSYVSFREIWNMFEIHEWTDEDLEHAVDAISTKTLEDVLLATAETGQMTFRTAIELLCQNTVSYLEPVRTHVNEAANG